MTLTEKIITILIAVFTTIFTRFISFIIFYDENKIPKFIHYLNTVLPFTVMGILVIYSLKDINFINISSSLKEIISILFLIILHLWKRNMFLSIFLSTALYMFLCQQNYFTI